MHDLKLEKTLEFDDSFSSLPDKLRTAELIPVATAFVGNMKRVQQLGLLPERLIMHGLVPSELATAKLHESAQRHAGKPIPPMTSDQIAKILLPTLRADAWSRVIEMASEGSPDPEVWDGFSSIHSSQLIGTWTAFETMASLLWEEALNVIPKWAMLSGKQKQNGKDSDRQEQKQISLDVVGMVTGGEFDLSKSMGTIHRKGKKFNFSKLERIRDAYKAAFDATFEGIHSAIDDKSLDALSAVRNLLVHAAGVADSDYVNAQKKGTPAAPILELGVSIALDGEKTLSLICPVVTACVSLMKAIDDSICRVKES